MNEEMRKKFEEFCKLNLFVSLDVDGDGNFSNRETKDKFILWRLAWKASREAMNPIKLPEPAIRYEWSQDWECGYADGSEMSISECKKAIQQAGYKVEE